MIKEKLENASNFKKIYALNNSYNNRPIINGANDFLKIVSRRANNGTVTGHKRYSSVARNE